MPRAIDNHLRGRTPHRVDMGETAAQVYQYDDLVLKIERDHAESKAEHEMLHWLQDRLPVPRLVASAVQGDTRYLLSSLLPGRMACATENLRHPERLIQALADGLRQLWDVDITTCPQRRTLDVVLEEAETRLKQGQIELDDLDPVWVPTMFSTLDEALSWLKDHRVTEELVFTHGDYCLPNVFLQHGQVSGMLDLGRAGIADRYQDIALVVRSLRYNLGERYEDRYGEQLFEQLGLQPHPHKMMYYTLLDEFF